MRKTFPYPHAPLDANGKRINKGDLVRIVDMPDLSGMDVKGRRLCEPVFQHIRGKCKRVVDFDDFGCAELFFTIRSGRRRGMHSVAIEPSLLLRQ